MKISEFLPVFKLRVPNIMFLLGAGSSVSAGIPTAWDMIWDFKRTLFCAENKKPISYCQDLSNPVTRGIIQSYFDTKKTYPVSGAETEYAYYFETLYQNENDRRRYIEQLVSNGKPSYGHLVLASLLKLDKIRVVWTTNFDRIIEDATIPILGGSGKLVTANLDNANVAFQALNEGRWPILVKLHGDYQSTKLKNTSDELKKQDAVLVDAFVDSCKRYGLAVMGYSGRDKSIIDALQKVVDSGRGFPGGLFWFYRTENPPFEGVQTLIKRAIEKGVDAHLIEIETFDELMGDLLLLEESLPDSVTNYIDQSPRRVTDAPIKTTRGIYPILRFNALRITSWPNTCRKLICDIGGVSEVRDAVKQSNADLVAIRRREGVLYFGSDDEAKKAFGKYKIKNFDVHTILVNKIRYDSQELGLLYDAFSRAVGRNLPLRVERKRNAYYFVITNENNDIYNSLRLTAHGLSGVIKNTAAKWSEALEIKLQYKHERLWLLITPTIWLDRPDNLTDKEMDNAQEFVRERLATRYNSVYNSIMDSWISILVGTGDDREFTAFGIQNGVDAKFVLTRGTAYSMKAN